MPVLGAPETLAEFVEIEVNEDSALTLANIANAIKIYPINLNLKNKIVSTRFPMPPGRLRGVDLTVKQIIGPYRDSFTITHLVESIPEWTEDIDWEIIVGHLQQGNVGQLPVPFKPKATIADIIFQMLSSHTCD